MTDLIQAIAELRRVTPPNSPWEAGDIGVGSSPVDYRIATILNAVTSGDLIPRAEADLAELATLRAQVERLTGALKLCRPWLEGPASGDCSHPEHAAADLAEIDATLTEGAAP